MLKFKKKPLIIFLILSFLIFNFLFLPSSSEGGRRRFIFFDLPSHSEGGRRGLTFFDLPSHSEGGRRGLTFFDLPSHSQAERRGFAFSEPQKISDRPELTIHFFYSALCPVCVKAKEFLRELPKTYPTVEIKEYEVLYQPENQKILSDFYQKYQVPKGEQGIVPIIFLEENYFLGFNEQIAKEIEDCLKECLFGQEPIVSQKIKVPILGEIDILKLSLPVLTVILAALDGFNPCALWIMIFLVTILINARSRKKLLLIGGTFILASGIIYYVILTAWLNLFLVIGYVHLTRILIGTFALGMGIWQIKNFITYNPGVCRVLGLSYLVERQLKIKERVEKIANAPLINFTTILGLIVLAFGVNLVEFFCSAGLPAIFTRVLALNPLTTLGYHFYLLLYTFVFMLDEIIILSVALITLKKIGFTDKYNYWATLIGGILIFILGLLLIFKPEVLMFI